MKSPGSLPLGREVLAWVRQGGKPTRAGWSHQLKQSWQGFWFEHNLTIQRQLPPAPALKEDPLFILGLWRSGTTYLHDLLSACPGMLYPATWQCMSPASLRLQSPPSRGNAVQRPMDGLTIDNLSPQEDEFALLALGVPSVYRGFMDPRRLPELAQWLDPESWSIERPAGWLDVWRQFLTDVSADRPRRLVLKSPSHTFRIKATTAAFPRSDYIWLVRDPVETFCSNRKMWRAMFERYALWEWDNTILDEFLARAFELVAECLLEATRLLPRDRLVVISFDQLTGATLDTMERAAQRLELGNWQEIHPLLDRIAASKADYRPETYQNSQLPQNSMQAMHRLGTAQLMALSSHGL